MADELIDNGMDWEPLSDEELARLAEETLNSSLMREEPKNSGISITRALELLDELAESDISVSDLFPHPQKQ